MSWGRGVGRLLIFVVVDFIDFSRGLYAALSVVFVGVSGLSRNKKGRKKKIPRLHCGSVYSAEL